MWLGGGAPFLGVNSGPFFLCHILVFSPALEDDSVFGLHLLVLSVFAGCSHRPVHS